VSVEYKHKQACTAVSLQRAWVWYTADAVKSLHDHNTCIKLKALCNIMSKTTYTVTFLNAQPG